MEQGGGGRGGAGGAARGPAPVPIPRIGPELTGTPLIAWDPVAQKERWHADNGAAGFNQGGTLSTAGNLVFAGVRSNLRVYRADTGQQLLDVDTHLNQVGPPMTFMLDGKQYIAIAGGPQGNGGGGSAALAVEQRLQAVADRPNFKAAQRGSGSTFARSLPSFQALSPLAAAKIVVPHGNREGL